jgi:glycosyltransferase involved in cell wall biosynthesis
MSKKKIVNILGIRSIPAAHGGFETFAGQLAPYLRDAGWTVNVYCQLDPDQKGNCRADFEDDWEGIHRIHLGTKRSSAIGTMMFDWRCILDVLKRPGVNLVLGYNTAIFSLLLRSQGRSVIMNMDGVEWKRAKWSVPIKAWFYLNEFIGAHVSTMPVADHPEIAKHLRRHGCRRSIVIPYGSDKIDEAPVELIESMSLVPGEYFVSIARVEPENSILEIVRAFSAKPRKAKLVVLGNLNEANSYHRKVKAAASKGVLFPGAIYDKCTVSALRFHALAYLHGHQVGGTNPSLVEALGAGNAIIAHDNRFNRWVAGNGQFFFSDEKTIGEIVEGIENGSLSVTEARKNSSARHRMGFTLEAANREYETLLTRFL